jgi:phytoene desaturase
MSFKVVHIIGSGFAALSASCYLAKAGYDVTILEKNEKIGGRAVQLKVDDFLFDMGPTWYWMPDVFERFFEDFGLKVSDFYELEKMNPAYEVFFGKSDSIKIGDNLKDICDIFEKLEPGSSSQLELFIKDAKKNYEIAIKELVYQPGISMVELITPKTIFRLHRLFSTIQNQIVKKFSNPKLIKVLEFPVLFLGAKPSNTPALYNFMNWADFGLGTWNPKGGMYSVIKGMTQLATNLGVKMMVNSSVEKIVVEKGSAIGINIQNKFIPSDIILSGADYFHTETLLDSNYRQYSNAYWKRKTFAPSALIFYVGLNKKLKNVSHHNLFFDCDFEKHATSIYDKPQWPNEPLFYARFPSISDNSYCPEGKEALTFLIPIANELEDSQQIRDKYFKKIISRFQQITNQQIENDILFCNSFCVSDFKSNYNSYGGNAYGLANTLSQTAFLRPKIKSSKVKNLFFTGQLTVPGPGVPPAIISGKIAASQIIKNFVNK